MSVYLSVSTDNIRYFCEMAVLCRVICKAGFTLV